MQQVDSTKTGYTNSLSLGTHDVVSTLIRRCKTSYNVVLTLKQRRVSTGEQRISSKKSNATLTVVVLNHNSAVYVAFAKFSEPKEFVRLLKKVEEKVYSRTTTKLIPLLQPEHGFIRQNGPKRFQVQD